MLTKQLCYRNLRYQRKAEADAELSRAVAMSLEVVRAFIRLRKVAHSTRSLRKKVVQLESAVNSRLDRHDSDISLLFKTVKALLKDDAPEKSGLVRRIGFVP